MSTSISLRPADLTDVPDGAALGAALAALLDADDQDPRLLALGEPRHGDEAIPRLRNAALAHLVAHAGFTGIALESCCLRARRVDAYVRGGDGTEDDVLERGFSHGFGTNPANRELVRWLRDHNAGRPAAGQVGFFGFDGPLETMGSDSPREALGLVYAYAAAALGEQVLPCPWERVDTLLGADERWSDEAAVLDPTLALGATPEAHELRRIADDLQWLLAGDAPRLAAETDPDARRDAELAARSAAGLLAYHAAMAEGTGDHGGPLDTARLNRAARIRDTMMADNLAALAARGPGRTLVFAQNAHLRTGLLEMAMGPMNLRWYPAGALLHTRGRDRMVVVGSAIGTAPHLGIGPPPPGTVEGALAAASPAGPCLVPAVPLAAAVDAAADASGRVPSRPAEHFAYSPLDPDRLTGYDAILFVPEIAEIADPAG